MAATLAEGDDDARERRARAGGRRPRALPRRDGRADRRRRAPIASRSKASRALHGATHAIMPDRIETGTFLAAVAAARRRCDARAARRPATLDAVLDKLAEAGADDRRRRRRDPRRRGAAARAVNAAHGAVSGLPDRHAGADDGGRARAPRARRSITETIFENRMMHVQELVRLGADIERRGQHRDRARRRQADRRERDGDRSARVGVPRDRRARWPKATTTIDRIYHLDRGYERIEEQALGARRADPARRQ